MYLEYWKLKEKPFENVPDPRFFFPSDNHRDSLQKLLYAIRSEKGCAMLSGDYGCGKTVLVRTAVNELDKSGYETALINYPIFDRESFLKEILRQFGREPEKTDPINVFRQLSEHFYENVSQGKKNLLIIDEAQLIDDPNVYEELRLVLNIQLEDRFLINILLVGQPELREKVMLYPQLDQRIPVKCHLRRFDQDNTAAYLQHRLKVAGAESEIFTEEARYLIYRISNGVPRRINNVADLSLWECANREIPEVGGEIFKFIV
jgi:general secretion pathway protein A